MFAAAIIAVVFISPQVSARSHIPKSPQSSPAPSSSSASQRTTPEDSSRPATTPSSVSPQSSKSSASTYPHSSSSPVSSSAASSQTASSSPSSSSPASPSLASSQTASSSLRASRVAPYATGATVSPATGGTNIPPGTFVTLSGPSVSESSSGDIGTGAIVLQAPTGFQFDTSQSVTASVSSQGLLCGPLTTVQLNGASSQTVTPAPTQIAINVSRRSFLGCRSTIMWSGIRVKATTAGASGNITKAPGGSSISGVTDGVTNFGTLSAAAPALSMSLSTSSATFGNNLSASGSPSDQPDVGVFSAAGRAYYVKSGAPSSYAVSVTVTSNTPWSGSVSATENTGTSGMKISEGSMRWTLGDTTSLGQAQNATPFTTSGDSTVFNNASSCSSGAPLQPGSCVYNFDYILRVLWTDAPGSFNSVVTYTATPK